MLDHETDSSCMLSNPFYKNTTTIIPYLSFLYSIFEPKTDGITVYKKSKSYSFLYTSRVVSIHTYCQLSKTASKLKFTTAFKAENGMSTCASSTDSCIESSH